MADSTNALRGSDTSAGSDNVASNAGNLWRRYWTTWLALHRICQPLLMHRAEGEKNENFAITSRGD